MTNIINAITRLGEISDHLILITYNARLAHEMRLWELADYGQWWMG